jgi:ParB-like partition proteins
VEKKWVNPFGEAQGYKRLIDEFSYDREKVAKFIGKSRAHITNCLRLLSLPNEVICLIEDEKLSQGHAKILVGLDNSLFIAKKIIEKKLSVRQSETLVRSLKGKKRFKSIIKDPKIKDLETNLEEKTGIETFIKNKKNNSRSLTFEYKDLDQLNRLVMVIKANY